MGKLNRIVSPYGRIVTAFLRTSTSPYGEEKTAENEFYTVVLAFDGTSEESLNFKQQVEAINKMKVVTESKHLQPGEGFLVKFKSRKQPKVLDESGTNLNETEAGIPIINTSKGDSGKARVESLEWIGNKGNTLVMTTVQLRDLVVTGGIGIEDYSLIESEIEKDSN